MSTDTDPATPADAGAPPPAPGPVPPPVRHPMRWTRALWVSVAAFMVWLLLDAPTLQHNAQVSPLGARRTVALDVLGPIATVSRGLQVSHIVSLADGVLGRNGNVPGHGTGLVTVGPTGKGATTPPVHHLETTTDTAAPPATTTTTTVPPDPRPTAADPLRVLIVGDSLGIDLGQALQNDLANTGVVLATLDGRESTGLSRPDYFDWPAELQADVARIDPQVVVVMMGANDPQGFPGPPPVPYGTPQWNVAYGQRVNQFMRIATSRGAPVIWVGMPPMQDPWRNAAMADIDGVDAAQAKKVPRVTFVSSWNLLGGPKGIYLPFIVVNGQAEIVRDPDGTHLSPAGGEVLSQAVLAQMRRKLHITLPG